MPFPATQRVFYQRNPLEEVLCQLTFPTMLRLDGEAPASFQERIRAEYPTLKEAQTPTIPNIPNIKNQAIVEIMSGNFPFSIPKSYAFTSADDVWTITLARDSIGLNTKQYKTWEDFKLHLSESLTSLLDIYKPSFFTRIGLRYRDVIYRSRLGLEGVPWAELVQSPIATVLSSPAIANEVQGSYSQSLIRLDEFNSLVKLQYFVGLEQKSHEECFVIDADFFTEERMETRDADTILDYFNHQAGRLFHWSIQQRLHDAMVPTNMP